MSASIGRERAPGARRLVRVLIVSCILALVGWGLARAEVETTIASFLPAGDAAQADYEQRESTFGAEPVVVLLRGDGPRGLLLDPEQLALLVALEGALSRVDDVVSVYGPGTILNQSAGAAQALLRQVAGTRDAARNLAERQARADGLTKIQVRAAGDRAVARIDRRYSQLVVQAMPTGLPTLSNPEFVAAVLLDDRGEPRPQWRFLLPDARRVTLLVRPAAGLDQRRNAAVVRAVRSVVADAGLAVDDTQVVGVPVLTSSLSASVEDEVPVVGAVALGGVALVLLLLPWSRRRRLRLLPLVSSILGATTVVGAAGLLGRPPSLAVVAFLPVMLGVGTDFALYLWQPGRHRRVLVAAAGAAAAFLALVASPLGFVDELGLALALGLAATIGWTVVLRPFFPPVETLGQPEPTPEPDAPADGGLRAVPGRAVAVVLLVLLAVPAAVGWWALGDMEVQTSPRELVAGHPQLRELVEAENVLGFSGELAIVLRGPDILTPEALAWSRSVETAVVRAHGDRLRPLLTADRLLGFLGPDPSPEQVEAGAGLVPAYLLGAAVGPERDVIQSTFGVELDDVQRQAQLVDELSRTLPEPPEGYVAEVVGLPVVTARGLDLLSSGRYLVAGIGIVAAALVVGVGLRSARTAVSVAVASATAAGMLYFGLWVFDVGLSPLTLTVGALVAVTACEFATILPRPREPRPETSGRSVAAVALAGAVGYAALWVSDLEVLRSFGTVLAVGVACSYVAARVTVAALHGSEDPSLVEEVHP
ncbi:MAG: MMPL family transporter [Propionibacteriales bacterium]|nr:MMPL family transporter [Propionibacteriales bacterium]